MQSAKDEELKLVLTALFEVRQRYEYEINRKQRRVGDSKYS